MMSVHRNSVLSAMMDLIEKPNAGLQVIALCGRVIAADALFNVWVYNIGKSTLDDDRMLALVELYGQISRACLDRVTKIELPTETDAMLKFLQDVAKRLEEVVAHD